MPDLEHAIQTLTGVTGELVREHRTLVQGLAADRTFFRETLRELNGFVATAGIALERLERQVARLAEVTEIGFTRLQLATEETHRLLVDNNRLIVDNNRLIADNNRQIVDNNRLIAENNEVIRRLLDILSRGRQNGDNPPA